MCIRDRSKESYSFSKGLKRLGRVLQEVGVDSSQYAIYDGSGLSHDNRLSARGLSRVLQKALTDDKFNVEFASSLSVDGKSGTLKKRSYEGVARAKTGTLTGVRSLAGVMENSNARKIGFVIIQNKVSSPCLLYTSPSPRDATLSRMPSSA